MKILTGRLKLTHFKSEYAEEFTQALSDPRIFRYLPESVPTVVDIQNLIRNFKARDLQNSKEGFTGTNLAIFHRESRKIMGWCGLQPFEPVPDKKEIFFGLSPAWWNRGYMTEAAAAVLDYGFNALHLDEIVAGVKPENKASIAVLEKIGLLFRQTLETVPPGCEFYLGEHFYSITKEAHTTPKA